MKNFYYFKKTSIICLAVLAWLCVGIMHYAHCQTAGQIYGVTIPAESSEWEATAFNNGRRIVRDANGYFHAFWHSKQYLPAGPSGSGAHIFYSHTILPASEPPSMAIQMVWTDPVNLTIALEEWGFTDHRYPSAAVEYDIYDGKWKDVNNIHLVWQAFHDEQLGGGNRYEVLYASIPVMNPPNYSGLPFFSFENFSLTPGTDSLVPSIAVNQHNGWTNQHIHVVWQEEDINDGGNPNLVGDALFSDIAYIRSTDSGLSWVGPAGGWGLHLWDNISQTATNSQMPSVSCILDQFTGAPAQTNRQELGYNTNTVHVTYHEDYLLEEPLPDEIHIYYLCSPNDGLSWQQRTDVTLLLNLPESDKTEAYPSLAVDMMDNPHIGYMINNMQPAEPLRYGGPNNYLAGIHPQHTRSYPGPNPGMYGNRLNDVVAAYYDGNSWQGVVLGARDDNEFPTIALDRFMHENINYQGWAELPMPDGDYEIIRHERLSLNVPSFPLVMPVYGNWSLWINDSFDGINDDFFPNLAHKRVAVYKSPVELSSAGYDEIWTKVVGHGADQATSTTQMRKIWQDGNMWWLDPDPSRLFVYGADNILMNDDDPPSESSGTYFGRVALNRNGWNALSLVNLGPHDISISGLSTNGPNANEFTGVCPVKLTVLSTNVLTIGYNPTTAGSATATLDIASDSLTPLFSFNLAGEGAYTLVGQKSGAGTITPEGELLMLPGESTNFVIQANAYHYIGICETNHQSVSGVAGLDTYSVDWNNISHTGLTYTSFLNVTNDTATNNTPVPWLREYYTDESDLSALMARAEEDSDGDGAAGWEENIMDTDPTNINSVLKVVVISNLPPFNVFFEASSNRTYTLQYVEHLTNTVWVDVLSPNAGPTGGVHGVISLSDTNVSDAKFYRILVED